MFKKSKIIVSFALCFLIFAILPITMSDIISAQADGVAEIAMEMNDGRVLAEKNADAKLPMASTTKIMTALLVAEDCDLNSVIEVPKEAVGVEGSSIYLKEGERLSIKDLLYGLMMRSGNDAACALAIAHSGSVDKFVDRMNSRAQELGALNTHFDNPSGLPSENHYTTARDLCNIARAAMKNEIFANVVSTKHYDGDFRTFVNKNKMLSKFDGANGVKTGYTEKAGRCLVSSAKRENFDVICVVLNCYDMYERSCEILERCLNDYRVETISKDRVFYCSKGACSLDDDFSFTVETNAELEYKIVEPDTDDDKNAVAKLEIYALNNLIFTYNLYSIK